MGGGNGVKEVVCWMDTYTIRKFQVSEVVPVMTNLSHKTLET